MQLPKALARNPYDKAKCGGHGVVMAYALPAKREVIDVNVAEADCPKERCQDCQIRR